MNDFSHGGNLIYARKKYKMGRNRIIDFSANINPLGIPTGIKRLLCRNISNIVNYPDPASTLLIEAISDKHKIKKENIITGNGSNELIYLLLGALSPEKVTIPIPSYSEYERASLAAGAGCRFLDIIENGKIVFDLENIAKRINGSSEVFFLCNPHNPTGNLFNREDILYLLDECRDSGSILVVDEAFMPFTLNEEDNSVADLAGSYNNLIVLRSMTKIYAIPGLRLGYLLGSSRLISDMRIKQSNWQVNSLAQDIGPYLLGDNKYLSKSKALVSRLKDQFYRELKKFDWIDPYYPPVNFILCKLKSSVTDSKGLGDYLVKNHSMLIRDCSNFRGLDHSYIRLAVKSRKENLKLIECLKKFDRGL